VTTSRRSGPWHQPFVPGGPGKSVVSCGKTRCNVGWTLLGAADVLGGRLGRGSAGFAGGGGALGATVVMIAGGVLAGMREGACVGAGAVGGGGSTGAAVVVVIGMTGTTAPVRSAGPRATTRTADTMTPTADIPTAVSAIASASTELMGLGARPDGRACCARCGFFRPDTALSPPGISDSVSARISRFRISRRRLLDRARGHR
jgi:hypothetical protein